MIFALGRFGCDSESLKWSGVPTGVPKESDEGGKILAVRTLLEETTERMRGESRCSPERLNDR